MYELNRGHNKCVLLVQNVTKILFSMCCWINNCLLNVISQSLKRSCGQTELGSLLWPLSSLSAILSWSLPYLLLTHSWCLLYICWKKTESTQTTYDWGWCLALPDPGSIPCIIYDTQRSYKSDSWVQIQKLPQSITTVGPKNKNWKKKKKESRNHFGQLCLCSVRNHILFCSLGCGAMLAQVASIVSGNTPCLFWEWLHIEKVLCVSVHK